MLHHCCIREKSVSLIHFCIRQLLNWQYKASTYKSFSINKINCFDLWQRLTKRSIKIRFYWIMKDFSLVTIIFIWLKNAITHIYILYHISISASIILYIVSWIQKCLTRFWKYDICSLTFIIAETGSWQKTEVFIYKKVIMISSKDVIFSKFS